MNWSAVFVFSSIVNAEAARQFCEHHECPASWKDANEENCCIHHANIHSCPLGYMVRNLLLGLLLMTVILDHEESETLVQVTPPVWSESSFFGLLASRRVSSLSFSLQC